jgi:hypothetical protein
MASQPADTATLIPDASPYQTRCVPVASAGEPESPRLDTGAAAGQWRVAAATHAVMPTPPTKGGSPPGIRKRPLPAHTATRPPGHPRAVRHGLRPRDRRPALRRDRDQCVGRRRLPAPPRRLGRLPRAHLHRRAIRHRRRAQRPDVRQAAQDRRVRAVPAVPPVGPARRAHHVSQAALVPHQQDIRATARKLTEFAAAPSPSKLPAIFTSALRGCPPASQATPWPGTISSVPPPLWCGRPRWCTRGQDALNLQVRTVGYLHDPPITQRRDQRLLDYGDPAPVPVLDLRRVTDTEHALLDLHQLRTTSVLEDQCLAHPLPSRCPPGSADRHIKPPPGLPLRLPGH